MAYPKIKKISRALKLYRLARWVNRNFLNREELIQEKSDMYFYANLVGKDDLVFDVGANYGEKSRIFLKLGCNVVAFEPQSDCMNELKSRCGQNKKLIAVEAGVSSKSGLGRFYVHSHRDKSSLIKDWQSHVVSNIQESEIEVNLVTLDEMINKYGSPKYIKIDVEGHERDVLLGLTKKVSLISFEYHFSDSHAEEVRHCIEHLSGIWDIVINVTPAEKLEFGFDHWVGKEEFFDRFYGNISKKFEFGYGDVWVKASSN